MSMGNFPAFDWLVNDVLKIDPKLKSDAGEFKWTHPVTHKVMKGYTLERDVNGWANRVGYWGKMRFEFFEESERELLRYLDILGITKNYCAYYNLWMCERYNIAMPKIMCRDSNKEAILTLKENNYDEFMRIYRNADTIVREYITSRVLCGQYEDNEVDLVLLYFYDEIQKYLENKTDEVRYRRDTPMMFWKNHSNFYPDFDENFKAKLKKWRYNVEIDERFFPIITSEEKALWEEKQAKRKAEFEKLLAENMQDDISAMDEFTEMPF